jgi:uncharacterized repeat protein (TIGR03803 family)
MLQAFAADGSDGANPIGGVIQGADGNFYGTTYVGGAFDDGTVFRMNAAGALTTLHAFASGVDGGHPYATLLQAADGNFYGTTAEAAADLGTVFKMDAAGTVTTLHAFAGGGEGAIRMPG